MITRGQPAGTSVMGAGPRDGLVCFSGTLGKTHPGKCISEAFWNVLRTCWSGPEGSWPTRAQRVRAPSGAVWSSEGLNGVIGGWVELGQGFALPYPVPSTSVFVCFVCWCVCTCVHARVREDWPGFYGGNLDPNQAFCAHPSSAFTRHRTWGGGEAL